MSEDLYSLLGVSREAKPAEIKRAYRKLARKYHPDVNPGDKEAEQRFKKISAAYAVLSDPEKRKRYNTLGSGEAGGGGFPFGMDFREGDFPDLDFSLFGGEGGFAEILAELLGRQGAPGRGRRAREGSVPRRGEDLQYTISIPFEDSIRGLLTRISITRRVACPACGGGGAAAGTAGGACPACGGSGRVSRQRGGLRLASPCPDCRGTGRLAAPPCEVCRGEGRTEAAETIRVRIPPGVSDGSRVRVPGKGEAGSAGGAPGDLHIVTRVAPHRFFTRQGDNIYCSVPITLEEALLGARIEIPTVDGRTTFKVPPGTQSGQKFKLRGKGAPSLRGGMRGDQYVEVKIVLPALRDERSKEIIREFSRLNAQEDLRSGIG